MIVELLDCSFTEVIDDCIDNDFYDDDIFGPVNFPESSIASHIPSATLDISLKFDNKPLKNVINICLIDFRSLLSPLQKD